MVSVVVIRTAPCLLELLQILLDLLLVVGNLTVRQSVWSVTVETHWTIRPGVVVLSSAMVLWKIGFDSYLKVANY